MHEHARQEETVCPFTSAERRRRSTWTASCRLQQTLATLADLQLRYEIERDYLEDWSGPAEIRDRLVAELNNCHTANREQLMSCLAELQRQARRSEPATPRRTNH